MKKLIFITIFILTFSTNSFTETAHFIDFYKVLNNSKVGAKAQSELKNKFESESKKYSKIEKNIKKKESELISQKQTISAEEYQKKVEALRAQVADLQKNKQDSFKKIAKSRNDAKLALLKSVNPIIKKYMEDKKIEIILDKKGIVMANTNLEITDQIIAILNKEVSSLKIN